MSNRVNYLIEQNVDICNHKSQVFGFHTVFDIEKSTEIEFAMKIPSNKILEVLPAAITTSATLYITFYQDITLNIEDPYDANIYESIRCMNQYNPKTSAVQELLTVPDITDYGEENYSTYIPAAKGESGAMIEGIKWITKGNCYYSVKIENRSTEDGVAAFSLLWIERDEI